LTLNVLVKANTARVNAMAVADAVVAAEADGIPSHGASRVPFYADQALSGKVNGQAQPELVASTDALVVIDAHSGFAFPAIRMAIEHGLTRADRAGVAAVAVRHSHHAGVGGYHVEHAANEGYIALGLTNTPAAIAPWGGCVGTFGTNPIAFASPRFNQPPLVVDLSLSRVARGKIMQAQQNKAELPLGWARDANGNPTSDPAAALKGTMEPLGDAKGAALALIVEILCAAVTGSNFAFEASSFFDAHGAPPHVGQFFILLKPERFAVDDFERRVEHLLAHILAQESARLPGDRRLKHRRVARRNGIVIPDSLHRELVRRRG